MNVEWRRFLSQRPAPFWGSLGAAFVLALAVAEAVWRFWPGRPVAALPLPPVLRPGISRDFDVQHLLQAHLFGHMEAPGAKMSVAPDTRLRLRLVGVVASRDPDQARAMIVADGTGKAKSFAPGRSIAGTDAVLHAIEENRVLILRGGVIEQLKLERRPREVSSHSPVQRMQSRASAAEPFPAPDISPMAGGVSGQTGPAGAAVNAGAGKESHHDENGVAEEEAESEETVDNSPPLRAPARK